MDIVNTFVIVAALIVNVITIIGYSNKHERRMTKIETLVEILVIRSGIGVRKSDYSLEERAE